MKSMPSVREIKNTYEDFSPGKVNLYINTDTGELKSDFIKQCVGAADKQITWLESNVAIGNPKDISVYTGSTGIAMMYSLLASRRNNSEYCNKALSIVEKSIEILRYARGDITFLTGETGPLCMGAALHYQKNSLQRAEHFKGMVINLANRVSDLDADVEDEILYGRAGYLYSLLYLNKIMGIGTVDERVIKQIISSILKSGERLARKERITAPLMYKWHDQYYIGAAHGLAGIVYMLLKCREWLTEQELAHVVKPTIDFIQDTRYASLNFPSSIGSTTDKLVQWCHGAPGLVHLFTEAYKTYGDNKYLTTALECGDVVWKRGLLAKGYSICHGVSGNGYTFLHLYNITNDMKHLHRACAFAHWCFTYGRHQGYYPDRPLSMFEGIAGAIYFLTDIQKPEQARFPGYEL